MKIEGKVLKNWFTQGIGLMFSKKRTVIFELRKERIEGIHMLFVFFPLDVYFLDKDKRIIEIKQGLKPFMFYAPKQKAKYIVETPFDIPLKKGDYVEW
ncbi:DUF192 domain-containing protein [Candidatus Woesearchaeota archaeon]|jgi:uncharacterized protein|nr:DUF192 domain-containing protein [Candidatus Woesearchaeota archaeon]MBT4368872.1 DUF192 domain-containing protein [Candidatus Woesearchaeota archaeon]MBT4712161.1 DUF192 domain-containing protein [Candidatus Woesearchaeota archaeon]MBT6639091.1 DUF192 domain-containing protein [Candidatus Woesearchaeota archaeon]MBT7134291.1 DUF192 domain-containing protein [Candidatus Woesearchaeota archaeon]